MLVVHAANYQFKKHGAVYSSWDMKMHQGLVQSGCFVYPFSVNDMQRLHSPIGRRALGTRGANRALVETCNNIRPDFLLLGHAAPISGKTVAEIREALPAMRVGLWWGDAIWEEMRLDHVLEKLSLVDAFYVSTAGDWIKPYAADGRVVAYVPNPVEPLVHRHRAFEVEDHLYDVVFFGRDDPRRNPLLSLLQSRLADLRVGFFGCLGTPPVYGAEKEAILLRSKMALNLDRRVDMPLSSSNRLIDTVANGVLTLCDAASNLQPLFAEGEVVYYKSPEDLVDKVRFYAAENTARTTVARRAWERSHRCYGANLVARFMIDAAFRRPGYDRVPWPAYILEDGAVKRWGESGAAAAAIMTPSVSPVVALP